MLNSLMSDPGLVLLILFIFMLVCRVPIAISLGLSAAIVSWLFDMGIDMLPYNFFAGVAKVPLLAIPFFILAGFIMESAGIAARIVRLVENLVGDMTGGSSHCNRSSRHLLGRRERIGPCDCRCARLNPHSGYG